MDFKHIFLGLVMIAVGVVTIKYNFKLVGFTGHVQWIEDHVGSGSTYGVFKLLSVFLIFTGILYGTGLHWPFFMWLFSPIRSVFTMGG